MNYRLPEMEDEDILKAYVQEHQENGEVNISASENVASEDYAHWVGLEDSQPLERHLPSPPHPQFLASEIKQVFRSTHLASLLAFEQ